MPWQNNYTSYQMMKWTLLQMSGGCISVLKAHWMIITGDMCSAPKAQMVKKIPCARKGCCCHIGIMMWKVDILPAKKSWEITGSFLTYPL